jgi:hypothetical protein
VWYTKCKIILGTFSNTFLGYKSDSNSSEKNSFLINSIISYSIFPSSHLYLKLIISDFILLTYPSVRNTDSQLSIYSNRLLYLKADRSKHSVTPAFLFILLGFLHLSKSYKRLNEIYTYSKNGYIELLKRLLKGMSHLIKPHQ